MVACDDDEANWPDLDSLPTDKEELAELVRRERQRLEDFKAEERKNRTRRMKEQRRREKEEEDRRKQQAQLEDVATCPQGEAAAAVLEAEAERQRECDRLLEILEKTLATASTPETLQADRVGPPTKEDLRPFLEHLKLAEESSKSMPSAVQARLTDVLQRLRERLRALEVEMETPTRLDDQRVQPDSALNAALAAVEQSIADTGLESEWSRSLAAALIEPSACGQIRAVLDGHAWTGTRFCTIPDRQRLLDDLLALDETGSLTSEDARVEAEIQELELLAAQLQRKASEEDALATCRSTCSTGSFQTADSDASAVGPTGGVSSSAEDDTPRGSIGEVQTGDHTQTSAACINVQETASDRPLPPSSVKGKGKSAAAPPAPPVSGKGPPGKAAGKGKPVAPPMSKAKGKGNGNGKGGLTPPKAAAVDNRLVNLRWKVSHEVEDLSSIDKAFLKRLEDARPIIDDDGAMHSEPLEEPPEVKFPERPITIFAPKAFVAEPPREVIEFYFTKSAAARTAWTRPQPDQGPPSGDASDSDVVDRHLNQLLDKKQMHMLGIMFQTFMMKNKGQSHEDAIQSIKRGVLRCDSNVVPLEGLGAIRVVLQQHEAHGLPICVLVRNHGGEAALDRLDNPEYHRLVYELSKVPQIDERLECMLFRLTFRENIDQCRKNLDTLRLVLEMLNSKREAFRKFFMTAHRLGQRLNRKSSVPEAPNGFQLSTLEKLSQTKCTKFPKMSLMHFVIALMRRDDARALFNSEDLSLLHAAKTLKTHKVYHDCVDLAQGIYGVEQICETGKYTCPSTGQAVKIEKRRKSLPPSQCQEMELEAAVDTDDRFHEEMKEFVEGSLEDAEDIAEGALDLILLYKELALYFDDLRSVYPPPKSESDSRKDLCDIFYRFAEDIRRHRDEVESEKLRELISASSAADAAAAAAASTEKATTIDAIEGVRTKSVAQEDFVIP